MDGRYWVMSKDGDARGKALYERHYSRNPVTVGRACKLFVGPGEKMVLISAAGDALFVWRRFIDRSGEEGVNCAIFRNEGPYLSSDMILEAEQFAWERWPGQRLYTYVNASKIRSVNPGYCFICAGWKRTGRVTRVHKLIVMEKTR